MDHTYFTNMGSSGNGSWVCYMIQGQNQQGIMNVQNSGTGNYASTSLNGTSFNAGASSNGGAFFNSAASSNAGASFNAAAWASGNGFWVPRMPQAPTNPYAAAFWAYSTF